MSIVNLVSGGLDSTLVGVLAKEEGIQVFPLFVNYGQRAVESEWRACQTVHEKLGLTAPEYMDLRGYGEIILSGLTSPEKHVKDEAFTPGRNLLFLMVGGAYAYQNGADGVAIGLLAERYSLFPDQRSVFLLDAERAIEAAMGKRIQVTAPLMEFSKSEVVALADNKGITDTYSCHAGTEKPCGECISCLEIMSNAS